MRNTETTSTLTPRLAAALRRFGKFQPDRWLKAMRKAGYVVYEIRHDDGKSSLGIELENRRHFRNILRDPICWINLAKKSGESNAIGQVLKFISKQRTLETS